jgi:hypothetical protein
VPTVEDIEMKPIKLKTATDTQIEAALAAVNGHARESVVTTAKTVRNIAESFLFDMAAEELTKRERAGAVMRYRGAGAAAKAYRYARNVSSLSFRIGQDGKTLFLTRIAIEKAWPRQPLLARIDLKPAAHSSWTYRKSNAFGVQAPALEAANQA